MEAREALFESCLRKKSGELRMFGRDRVSTRQALKTIDRAAGDPGFGHHYYATTGNIDGSRDPEFVLRPAVAEYLEPENTGPEHQHSRPGQLRTGSISIP
jgi:hypothetical protein